LQDGNDPGLGFPIDELDDFVAKLQQFGAAQGLSEMELLDLWAVVLPGCYGEEGQAFGDCVKQSLACFYQDSPVLQQLELSPGCVFDLLKSCGGGLLNSACLESHPVI
jgi:hypothetical protein